MSDGWFFVGIPLLVIIIGLMIPSEDFADKCMKAGGVAISGDICIDASAVIHIKD